MDMAQWLLIDKTRNISCHPSQLVINTISPFRVLVTKVKKSDSFRMRFPLQVSRLVQRQECSTWSSWTPQGRNKHTESPRHQLHRPFLASYVAGGAVSRASAVWGQDPHPRRGCRRVCVCICVCVPLSTSFTTQLIRLAALGNCNVHSRAPFIEWLGPCLPRTPFFSLQIKRSLDFLSLKNVLLPPCPNTPPTRCCHSLPHLPVRVIGLSENCGKFQAQNEANF